MDYCMVCAGFVGVTDQPLIHEFTLIILCIEELMEVLVDVRPGNIYAIFSVSQLHYILFYLNEIYIGFDVSEISTEATAFRYLHMHRRIGELC